MLKKVLLVLLVLGVAVGSGKTGEYQVVDVIEVGPCSGGPLFRPVKWSPDGSMIAYFNGKKLMVADTLGNTRVICTIEHNGRNLEWVSNDEIIFAERQFGSGGPLELGLYRVDQEGAVTSVKNESLMLNERADFFGPFKTPSGAVYYREEQGEEQVFQMLSGLDSGSSRADHHLVRAFDDRVVSISLDSKDTVTLLSGRYEGIVVNQDHSQALVSAYDGSAILHNLQTGIVDTIRVPEMKLRTGVYCGVGGYEFNPVKNLIVFNSDCDDGHSVEMSVICLYDCRMKLSYPISPITASRFERAPMFSPSGKFLSFISASVGLCIARLEEK